MTHKIRIGALISGGGTNLQAILDACEEGKIDGEVVFVGTDNPEAKGLSRAHEKKIPTFITDYSSIIKNYRDMNPPEDIDIESLISKQALLKNNENPEKMKSFILSRGIAESNMLEQMKPYPFDLLVLAGFMRNLTPYFIDKVNADSDIPKIMNIHPALLPSFPGVDGYGDTYRYGCKVGGCTVHFIDYGEDSGPIIGQKSFEIASGDTLDMIKAKGLKLEWELYPYCIQLFAKNRLEVVKNLLRPEKGNSKYRNIIEIKPNIG